MIIITCLAFENQSVFSLYYYMYIIIMQNENEITFCMKEALCTTRRFYSKVKSILIVYRDVKDFVYFILTWQVQYKKHKKVRCWIKVVSSCNGYFDLGKFKSNPRLKIVYYDKINPLEIYLYIGTYLKLILRFPISSKSIFICIYDDTKFKEYKMSTVMFIYGFSNIFLFPFSSKYKLETQNIGETALGHC